jgi:hypothetical protein
MSANDLSKLSPGMEVVIHYGAAHYSIAKVERVTSTQIIIGVARFRKNGGVEIGISGWSYRRLTLDPDAFASARQQKAQNMLAKSHTFTRQGVEQARAAADYAETILREDGKWESGDVE